MKYLSAAFMALLLVACSPRDEHYFQTHPQAIEDAVKHCPAKQPSPISCEQLTNIAIATNDLVYQIQSSPQGFGKKILALQEAIAKEKTELKANPNQAEVQRSLHKKELLLQQSLAVVRWLESPES